MALFRLPSTTAPALAPRGYGLLLRAPQMADYAQWSELREMSRTFLTPWEPIWPSDDLTRSGFRRRLRRYAEDVAEDRAYPFVVFREDDGTLVGGVTLANVRRGIVQAGTVGYWRWRGQHLTRFASWAPGDEYDAGAADAAPALLLVRS